MTLPYLPKLKEYRQTNFEVCIPFEELAEPQFVNKFLKLTSNFQRDQSGDTWFLPTSEAEWSLFTDTIRSPRKLKDNILAIGSKTEVLNTDTNAFEKVTEPCSSDRLNFEDKKLLELGIEKLEILPSDRQAKETARFQKKENSKDEDDDCKQQSPCGSSISSADSFRIVIKDRFAPILSEIKQNLAECGLEDLSSQYDVSSQRTGDKQKVQEQVHDSLVAEISELKEHRNMLEEMLLTKENELEAMKQRLENQEMHLKSFVVQNGMTEKKLTVDEQDESVKGEVIINMEKEVFKLKEELCKLQTEHKQLLLNRSIIEENLNLSLVQTVNPICDDVDVHEETCEFDNQHSTENSIIPEFKKEILHEVDPVSEKHVDELNSGKIDETEILYPSSGGGEAGDVQISQPKETDSGESSVVEWEQKENSTLEDPVEDDVFWDAEEGGIKENEKEPNIDDELLEQLQTNSCETNDLLDYRNKYMSALEKMEELKRELDSKNELQILMQQESCHVVKLMKEQCAAKLKSVQFLADVVEDLTKKLRDCTNAKVDVQHSLQKSQDELTKASQTNEGLEHQLENANTTLKHCEKFVLQLKKDENILNSLTLENVALRNENRELQVLLLSQEEKAKNREKEVEGMKHQHKEETLDELKQLRLSEERYKASLRAAQENISDLEHQLVVARVDKKQSNREKAEVIKETESKIRELSQSLEKSQWQKILEALQGTIPKDDINTLIHICSNLNMLGKNTSGGGKPNKSDTPRRTKSGRSHRRNRRSHIKINKEENVNEEKTRTMNGEQASSLESKSGPHSSFKKFTEPIWITVTDGNDNKSVINARGRRPERRGNAHEFQTGRRCSKHQHEPVELPQHREKTDGDNSSNHEFFTVFNETGGEGVKVRRCGHIQPFEKIKSFEIEQV